MTFSHCREKGLGHTHTHTHTHTQLWKCTNTSVVVINHWKDLAELDTNTSCIQLTSITENFVSINNWSWYRECNQRRRILSLATALASQNIWHHELHASVALLATQLVKFSHGHVRRKTERKKQKKQTESQQVRLLNRKYLIHAWSHSWPLYETAVLSY